MITFRYLNHLVGEIIMTEREVEILKDQLYGMTEDDLWWVPEKDLEGEPVDLSELNAFGLHLEEEN